MRSDSLVTEREEVVLLDDAGGLLASPIRRPCRCHHAPSPRLLLLRVRLRRPRPRHAARFGEAGVPAGVDGYVLRTPWPGRGDRRRGAPPAVRRTRCRRPRPHARPARLLLSRLGRRDRGERVVPGLRLTDGDPTPVPAEVAEWLWWDWEAFSGRDRPGQHSRPGPGCRPRCSTRCWTTPCPASPGPHHLSPAPHPARELSICARRAVHLGTASCPFAHGALCICARRVVHMCTRSAISPNDPPPPATLRKPAEAPAAPGGPAEAPSTSARPRAARRRAAGPVRRWCSRCFAPSRTRAVSLTARVRSTKRFSPARSRPCPAPTSTTHTAGAAIGASSTPRPDADQRGRTCGERDLVPRPSGQARHHQRHGYLHQPRQ